MFYLYFYITFIKGVIYPHIAIGHLEANKESKMFLSASKRSSFRKSIQNAWQSFVHNSNNSTILRYTVAPILNFFNLNEVRRYRRFEKMN